MLAVVVLYYMPKLMTNPRSKVTYSYDVIAWDCYQGTRKNRNYSVKAQCNDKMANNNDVSTKEYNFLSCFHKFYYAVCLINVISHIMSQTYLVNFSYYVLWGQE